MESLISPERKRILKVKRTLLGFCGTREGGVKEQEVLSAFIDSGLASNNRGAKTYLPNDEGHSVDYRYTDTRSLRFTRRHDNFTTCYDLEVISG